MRTTREILNELKLQGSRSDGILKEVRAQGARIDAALEQARIDREEERARWKQRDAELQQLVRFNTEAFRRSELAFGDFRAAMADFRTEFAEFRTEQREMREEQREVREDIRAHTRALLTLIDRLQGGGAAPAV